jgi:integrase
MGSIDRRPNGTWRARWRETANGEQHARHFARRRDAEQFLAQVSSDLLRGEYVDPSRGRILFNDYVEQWQRGQVHRATTAEQVDGHLRNHILPAFGTRPMASVLPTEVQRWVRALSERLAPATVEVVYRYFAAIFRSAVDDRIISSSPCRNIRLPKAAPRIIVPPSVAEVTALADAMPRHLQALVLFAAGTGARQGECFGLTLDRIDFLRRSVRIDRQLVALRGSQRLSPPKTASSVRTVPLPQMVVDVMAAHLATYPTSPSEFVFRSERLNALRRGRVNEAFRAAARIAGVGDDVTFHDLRHFYASLLIRSGCSVKVVQTRLGHKNASETLDTYGHLWADDEDRTRAAVDSAFAPSQEPRAARWT